MSLSVLLDALILVGLASVGVYCVILQGRLDAIRRSQVDLSESIAVFDQASRRAEAVLSRIDQDADARQRSLDVAGRRAEAIATELSVMIGAGDRIAARIESAVASVRTASEAKTPPSARKAA